MKNVNTGKKAPKIFKADKISGLESSIFGSAFFLDVLKIHNLRHKFKFSRYALTYTTKTNKADEWVDEKIYEEASHGIVKYVKKNGLGYFRELTSVQKKEAAEFLRFCNKILNKIEKAKKQELISLYYEFINIYFWCFAWGAITFLYEHTLSEKLFTSLAKKHENATKIIANLLKTKYKSFMIESEELLQEIKECGSTSVKNKLIKKYIENYFCIDTNYGHSPVMNIKRVAEKAWKTKKHIFQENQNQQKKYRVSNINLSRDEKVIVGILRHTELVRDKRKLVAMSGVYVLYRFLERVANANNIDLKTAEKAFWFEFGDLVNNNKEMIRNLRRRTEASAVLDETGFVYADRIIVSEKRIISEKIKKFQGTAASSGKYGGKVKIVLGQKDFNKIKKGDILVAEMTRPDFLPVMKKAGAIITDEGGLTCHAAIVAREMGIPCIVGTRIATRVLKDNQAVEVDGDKGVIKINN